MHLSRGMRVTRNFTVIHNASDGKPTVAKVEMETHFEAELKDLKLKILEMAGFAEQSIERAIRSLTERTGTVLGEVEELEKKINQAHIDVDNLCLGILARKAPVAVDLRLVLAVIKINTDLERMGDQALNMARNTEHYLTHAPIELAREYTKMSALVRTMVRESLDAFVNGDVKLAEKVLQSDDAVDAYKNRLIEELTQKMRGGSQIEASLNLILIARNLERMADHATNIAEDVIFMRTGRDVRHGHGQKNSPKNPTEP